MDVLPLSPFIAAEVRGLDVSAALSDAELRQIHDAWYAHLVLVFRGQALSDEQLVCFSRLFGELEQAPIGEAANLTSDGNVPNLPEVNIVSNVIENGIAIGGLGAGEAIWHTDMSYIPEPPTASLLYALEVPTHGGDTSFINMYEAFNALPDDLQHVVGQHSAKHDASHNSAGNLRKGFQPVTDVSQAPGAVHPMLRTHPENGNKALFLGRRRNAYIVDLPVEESERTLDTIWQEVSQGAYTYTHQWQVGDLLLWDNRCTMHRRDAFDSNARRIMHRTQIKGDKPF
jgi:taurine dioxygenase